MMAGIILAAGDSRRMESPKALLKIGGITFAESIASRAKVCGLEFIMLISGAHHHQIKEELKTINVFWNTRFKEGQLSSLKEGLRNLATGCLEALVWPVDQPLVREDTVRTLIETFKKERKRITVPVYQGRRGHPVIYDTLAIQAILGLSGAQSAKDVFSIFPDQIATVEVDDPGILIDIDTPEDYQKHIKDADL